MTPGVNRFLRLMIMILAGQRCPASFVQSSSFSLSGQGNLKLEL